MVIVFERGNALFIFNLHPTKRCARPAPSTRVLHDIMRSYTDYRVGTDWPGEYQVVLSSDDQRFGGHERADKSVKHFTSASRYPFSHARR